MKRLQILLQPYVDLSAFPETVRQGQVRSLHVRPLARSLQLEVEFPSLVPRETLLRLEEMLPSPLRIGRAQISPRYPKDCFALSQVISTFTDCDLPFASV